MKKFSLLLIMLPVIVGAMSITEVVQKALETHPQVQMKKEDLNAEQKTLTKVRAGYLPSIDLSYSVGPERTNTISNNRTSFDYTREDASATFTQPLFSGMSTVNGVKQQKALIVSADQKVKEGVNNLALEAATAYLEMLKNKELLQIAKENVDVHEKYLGQIKEKVDAGVGRSSDYKQTLSRYENAQSVYYLSEQNYENSIYNFQRVLPDEIVKGYLEKPTVGNLPAEDLETLVDMAIKNNPTVHVSQADIKAAQAAVSRSNSAYYPTADLRAQAFWDQNINGVGVKSGSNHDENSGWNVLLVLNYNLFNGMYDQANKKVNQHRVLKQSSTLADAKRFVTANTSLAWYTFKSTKQQLVHIEKNIQASAETVADYKEENDLGRRSIIDLLNIELEYNGAKNRKVTAEYDNLFSYYQILSHTGKILEVIDGNAK
ncbi:MAG: adhesin transport system outer membrane protein [Sulfurimonas sp.]|jgi:adhesin transport system outer membrane protein|uniref:TolC family outer membrane protein n=1 Tax=Sulfurimonas sp. TaxID=2022749 RepID=UPI0039E39274